jgi:hypothetical protein
MVTAYNPVGNHLARVPKRYAQTLRAYSGFPILIYVKEN